MSEKVVLVNIARPGRMLVFNIPADIAKELGMKVESRRVSLLDHDTGTGERRVRRKNVDTPPSIRVLAGAESEPLGKAVLDAPEVKVALNKTVKVKEAEKKPNKPPSQPKRSADK